MPAATAPVLVACTLLLLAGVPKVFRPLPAVRALRSVGAAVPSPLVRVGGAVEAAIGVLAVIVAGPVPTALVAASYGGFSIFLSVALRRGGVVSSCGCVGRADTPPTRLHLVLTITLAVMCTLAALGGGVQLRDIRWAAADVTTLAFTALAAWLAYLLLAVAPRVRLPRAVKEH